MWTINIGKAEYCWAVCKELFYSWSRLRLILIMYIFTRQQSNFITLHCAALTCIFIHCHCRYVVYVDIHSKTKTCLHIRRAVISCCRQRDRIMIWQSINFHSTIVTICHVLVSPATLFSAVQLVVVAVTTTVRRRYRSCCWWCFLVSWSSVPAFYTLLPSR